MQKKKIQIMKVKKEKSSLICSQKVVKENNKKNGVSI